MLQIVWKQKHQSEHGTCDKKILTSPSIKICPLFGELKKGIFMSPSQQFFLDNAAVSGSMLQIQNPDL